MVVGTSNGPTIPKPTAAEPVSVVGLPALFDRFVAESPLSVMARALLERTLQPEALDHLFLEEAEVQFNQELLFSSVVQGFAQVALRINPSMRQAYVNTPLLKVVSEGALYQKIKRLEPHLGPALVRYSARHMQDIISVLGGTQPPWRQGFRVKILDGNCLAGTHHRLKVLRGTAAAALPGKVLAVLDPRLRLFLDLIPCEDAYTQERVLLEQILPGVEANDVWVADRHFCTPKFLTGIAKRNAFFAIREHAQLNIRYTTELRAVGRCSTGMVFEQEAVVTDDKTGAEVCVRRVLVKLDKPTREGEPEIAVLTNLPEEVADARAVAELYLDRWTIETAFCELTVVMRCEIESLGYPKAALFSFAVAVLAANVLGAIQAALGAEHGAKKVEAELSVYQVATDIAGPYQGMMIAIPAEQWRCFAQMSLGEFAATLMFLAGKADWDRLQKTIRGAKKPPVKKPSASKERHVSTARLLNQAKEAKKQARANL
jgi:hypothetical protein